MAVELQHIHIWSCLNAHLFQQILFAMRHVLEKKYYFRKQFCLLIGWLYN
jgi:hypothetical protein